MPGHRMLRIADNGQVVVEAVRGGLRSEAGVAISSLFFTGMRKLLFLGFSCIHIKHAPQPIKETGTPRREFPYVDDLADACLSPGHRYDGEGIGTSG